MKWEAAAMDINIDTADINFSTTKTGDAKWWAGRDVNINRSDIDFSNTGAAAGTGYTEWFAQKNILMYHSFVDFVHDGPGNTKWHARDVNIEADNTPITFKNDGKGYTWWLAGNDILLHHQSPVKFTDAGTTNYLKLEAGRDFRTGINSPLLIDHKSPNPVGLPAHITIEATGRNIWTESSVDILNDGIQNQTLLYAGQDIRIDSTLTFNATHADGIGWVRMRAQAGDIIVNTRDADLQHPPVNSTDGFNTNNDVCDARRAAVNFTLAGASSGINGAGSTEWWAGKNIISNDTIHFHYANTGNKVQDLWMHADMENIDLRRILKIDFDSDSLIRWEALTQNDPARRQNMHSLDGGVSYNGTTVLTPSSIGQWGNIRTSDSVIINRTYAGAVAGKTQIDAYNDIQTAMFDYTSANTIGDLTDITSRMGDIWLGYSWKNPAECTLNNLHSTVNYDLNRFVYRVPNTPAGQLNIKAGYDDNVDNGSKYDGGNIYFTHIVDSLGKGGTYNTEISIPFSNMFRCGVDGNSLGGIHYERAGIIGGVARCQIVPGSLPYACSDTGLIHIGNNGRLLVDAGLRGNIIINNGTYLNFQDNTGNTEFRTRWGDIDMRYPFDVDSMQGSLLYLASSDLPNKLNVTDICGCDEKRNNIYLQDFQYNPVASSGSIFVGADNNIKLQYGGLKTIGTARDPFISGNAGYPCGTNYHCDSDTAVNQARDLILNFAKTTGGQTITSGGFAAVASDLIDVYTYMKYTGGQGSGMSSVPGYGNLHGESVAGYGLYIKTQANKTNWGRNALDAAMTACIPDKCDDTCNVAKSVLQNVARVTFHSDARIYAENQRTYIGSPVLETYGNLDLNTHDNKGGKTGISIQTDSLIVHDSLIIDGKLTRFTTWSGLYRDMPIFKLGHHRFTPPFVEDGSVCKPCFIHQKGTGTRANRNALDTLYVTFRNGASVPRLHTLIADHTVLSFLTDSFDHVKGDPTLNAKFYTDTFKIRNHVELYTDPRHERDGHFELISETQMDSKDYAGVYARHLHMEPIAPTCADNFPYSQLWMQDPALDVITTSTFGGYGWIHADVHVEIEATLAPGFASLREKGNYCYELKAGTLRMQDLRLDKGAELRYTIGDVEGFDGEKVDLIEVDEITMYGSVNVTVEKRCGQRFEPGCYPIIRYNSVAVDTVNLNNLKLSALKLDGYRLSLDTSIPGTVYLCVGDIALPQILRQVYIPETEGVTLVGREFGTHYVASMDNFKFTAKYATPEPLKVITNRVADDGGEEELKGILNANGEYEYVIRRIQQNIVLKFGPDFASDNELIDGRVVWSYNNTIYFRVEREDIASIYSITGQLVKRIDLPEGDYSVPMERGVYVVTLKDGSVHKVILK